jgi:hypothetical protein
MTTADQTSPQMPQSQRASGVTSDYNDEIDLIDIIGFVWRWRKSIIGSALAGMALGAGIWAFKHQSVGAPAAVGGQWTAVVTPATDDFQNGIIVANLTTFLKTEVGARTLFENPSILGAELNEPQIQRLTSQQQSGSGVLQAIETHGNQLAVTLDCAAGCNSELMAKAVPAAINRTIAAFNLTFVDPYEKAQEEISRRQLDLALVKTQALRLFSRYGGLSRDFNQYVVTGLGGILATDKTGDVVMFLLGPVPGNEPMRKKLIETQAQAQVAYTAAEDRLKVIKAAAGVETLTQLPTLPGTAELHKAPTAALPSSGKGLNNIVVAIILGGLLGGMGGIFLAAIRAFFATNAARLRAVISGRETTGQ